MYYVRIKQGFEGAVEKLIPYTENVFDHIKDQDKDWYRSVYLYNDKHYLQFKETGSVAGIRDVTGTRLVWDFDHEKDPEIARKDAIQLCTRLMEHGIEEDNIQVCWSGNKGFSVELETNEFFTPQEFKAITQSLAKDLETRDEIVTDPNRIIRLATTKHQKSGLYKRPLTVKQLCDFSVAEIRLMAQSLENLPEEGLTWNPIILPTSFLEMKKTVKKEKKEAVSAGMPVFLDFTEKPKGFPNCKYAIMNGLFENGQRNTAIMALAATCRAQRFPKEITYNMCKAAARLQADRTKTEPLPKEEIWNNIIEQVYATHWQGGQYSCKTDDTIASICANLGPHQCKDDEEKVFVELNDVSDKFADYAINIEKNTVYTGIQEFDSKVKLSIGMLVGLLGCPGSGKTNTSLNVLNHTSKNDVNGIFFSMDMASHLVYLKLIQKHTGKTRDEVFWAYKHDPDSVAQWNDLLKEEYKNIRFSFKTGYNVPKMKDEIKRFEDDTGKKVKLAVFDYLECIQGPYSDSTANTALISNELKDVGNEMDTCNLLLLQPQKRAGDPSEPLDSMRDVKGSSVIEQACSTIITLYRPGFQPGNFMTDKYITLTTVKDRMDGLYKVDLHWDGLTGTIRSLSNDEKIALRKLREEVEARKREEKKNGFGI